MDPSTIEILDRFRHTGFSAFQGRPVLPGDTIACEKPAVYILHPPLSLDRLSYDGSNGTVETTQDGPFPWAAETVYEYDNLDPV